MTPSARRQLVVCMVLALCVMAGPAHADAGVPMVMLVCPAGWVLLIPIIFAEAFVARRVLKTRFRRALSVSAQANALSTIVGVPATWAGLCGVEFLLGALGSILPGKASLPDPLASVLQVVAMSPWTYYDNHLGLEWVLWTSAMILCVPFFFMSVWVERAVATGIMGEDAAPEVRRWAWKANLVSYGLIVTVLLVGLVMSLQGKVGSLAHPW